MLRFDTRDIKPKVWNIAILSVCLTVLTAVLLLCVREYLWPVVVAVLVYLVLVLFFLLSAFVRQLQYNPYSYNSIYYIGFSLLTLSVLLAQLGIMFRIARGEYEGFSGLTSVFSALLNSAKTYMLLSFPFIVLYAAGLCLSNISLIRHEGRRLTNVLGILLTFLMLGGELFLYFSDRFVSGSVREVMLHDFLTNLFAAMYLYFECMLIGTIIVNVIVTRYEPEKDKAFIIILGCGIRKDGTPTPLLAGRIDRALRFYREQLQRTGKPPIFIASGGQGADEAVSESESMRAYLRERGVPEEHILLEDRSASTLENMRFSKKLIQTVDPEGKIIFSTTNYHVFRSGLMARRVKMRAVGIGAKTKWYFWPNAAVREFFGLLTEHRLKQTLILGAMLLLYGASTVLFYMTMG